MNIYVASKFENKEKVREAINLLTQAGHDIAADWTQHSLEGVPEDKKKNYQIECAYYDFNAVKRCHVLILLDHPNMKGAYTEVGIALGAYKPVIVVGKIYDNIFFHLPNVELVDTIEQAILSLANKA